MDLRYPIGRFQTPQSTTPSLRAGWIDDIAAAPARLREAVRGLEEAQLDTPYRPGGWTVRQVVHHVPDSHMNAYTRFKLALTEDTPTIKPYDEAKWAELDDGKSKLVEESLVLLEVLHKRWVYLLERIRPEQFALKVLHPEYKWTMSLDSLLAMYAWHGRHHVAHITELRRREGWS